MTLSLQNLPEKKAEEWKYTNLSRALPKNLVPVKTAEEDTVFIHRNGGLNGGQPVELLWTGEQGHAHSPRLKLLLEEGAECVLIERYRGNGPCWQNQESEISLAANAKLTHIRLFEDGAEMVSTVTDKIEQEEGSVYQSFYILHDNKLVRNEVHVSLNGPEASCDINGVNLLQGAELGDFTIKVEHKAPDCQSSQFVRSVLKDQARGVYQGKTIVERTAQKTNATQLCNALILSEGAEMDAKPELEIYADDVKCSHGATTGELDDEALFYLRSRGIPESEARSLLIEAFIGAIIEKLDDEALKTDLLEKARKWLD